MKPNKDAAKEKQGEPSETNNETQTEADEGEPRRTNETHNETQIETRRTKTKRGEANRPKTLILF